MSEPALSVQGIDVTVGHGSRRTRILRDVSLQIEAGEAWGLVGETGSGKSTLARAVLGLAPLAAGRIEVAGERVDDLRPAARRASRRRGDVQYVFQDPLRSLDQDLPVGTSVGEPLTVRAGMSRAEIDAAVAEQFGRVQLDPELRHRLPAELSGGQRQRAAIARALITSPRLVILDEPVSALDAANRVRILELLAGLTSEGVALLYISHDLGSVVGITSRTAVLYEGRIVESGESTEIVRAPQHPYTRLLVGSAPTLTHRGLDRAARDELRRALA